MSNFANDHLISVIIPTLNEEKHISACLQAARQNYPPDQVEIIVVDGGSQDGTCQQIPKHVKLMHTSPNRALQMNQGVTESKGDILIFCHGDTRLPLNWRKRILRALKDPQVTGGAFQSRLEPEVKSIRWINIFKLPQDWRFMYGDQGMFVRRSIFESMGGFPEIPLMEDVELARKMAKRGKVVRIDARVITDSRRMLENGPLRQIIGNAWRMISYLYLGASPEDIAKNYQSSREDLK